MGAGERVKGRGDLSLKRSAMQSQTFPVSADIFSTDSAVSMSFTGNSFPKPMGCRFWEMQNKISGGKIYLNLFFHYVEHVYISVSW